MKYINTIILITIIILLHFVVHELAHAVAAKLLGYDVIMGLNIVALDNQVYASRTDAMIVSIAGPVVTFLIALTAAIVSHKRQSIVAFWIVLTATFQRILAQIVSLGNPNDEMRVSIDLGVGDWTLPGFSIALFVILSIWAWQGPKPKPLLFFIAWIGMSIGFSMAVFGDRILPKIYW